MNKITTSFFCTLFMFGVVKAQDITIADLTGRIDKEAYNTKKNDVSSLAKGAYIVKVKINKTTKIGKLIKE